MSCNPLSIQITIETVRHIYSSLLPLILFFASGLLTGYGYFEIERDRARYMQGVELRKEETRYSVLQQGKCVGKLSTLFAPTADGEDLLLLLAIDQDPEYFKATLSFNDLGQLIGSEARIKSAQGDILFGSADANPIRAVVKGSLFDKPLRLQFEIPGPILKITRGTVVRLVQPRGKLFSISNQRDKLLASLGLEIYPSVTRECDVMTPLQVPDAILQSIGQMPQFLQGGWE